MNLYAENLPYRQQGEHVTLPPLYDRRVIFDVCSLLGLDPVDVFSVRFDAREVRIIYVVGTAKVIAVVPIGEDPDIDAVPEPDCG